MSKENPSSSKRRWFRQRMLVGVMIAVGLLLVIAANSHLVYVAMTSQPECVEHTRVANDMPGSYRAAKSAC